MNKIWALCIVGLLGIVPCVNAAGPAPGRYEIYSWKEGNEWDFSLLPALTNTPKAAVEIKNAGTLRGPSKVKEKLLTLKEGDRISWQERADSGMVYPPASVIEELRDYADSVGVRLEISPKITKN